MNTMSLTAPILGKADILSANSLKHKQKSNLQCGTNWFWMSVASNIYQAGSPLKTNMSLFHSNYAKEEFLLLYKEF